MRFTNLIVFFSILGLAQALAQEPAFLGARVGDITKEEAQKLGWEAPRGAKLVQAVPGGPAATAGLQRGDIIVSIDGVDISNYRHFLTELRTKSPGMEIHLKLFRNGKETSTNLSLMNSADALVDLGRVIAEDPNSIDAHVSRSELLFRLNRAAEAAPDCDQILRLAPDRGLGFYCRARVSIALAKPDAALEDLNTAVVKLPRSERPLITRAILYEKKKEYDAAIADLTRALAINEHDVIALAIRGEAYLAKALIDRAIDDFNAALAIDKDNARAKNGLQTALAKRNEVVAPETVTVPSPGSVASPPSATPPAAQQSTSSQQPTPTKGRPLIDVDPKLKSEVVQLQTKRDFKQALELVDKALAAAPDHAGLHNLRGSLLQLSGDFVKAIAEYDRSVSLQPQFIEAYANGINARLALRKTDEAMKAAEDFIRLNPDIALAYDLRGKVHVQATRLTEAQADFGRAIEKDPKLTVAWLDRGQIYLSSKDYEKAVADLSHAIELNPKSDSAYSFRGKAYLLQKNVGPAIVDFRKALSINGANWVAFTSLQALQVTKALQQLGQLKKD